MTKRPRSSGFKNDAADKIWNDHIGNNAFVRHRDQCALCQDVIIRTRNMTMRQYLAGQRPAWCADGERIFKEMLDEVVEQIDETLVNQN